MCPGSAGARWAMEEGVEMLTVYAFSTENWKRSKAEVDALMGIFLRYLDRIHRESAEKNVPGDGCSWRHRLSAKRRFCCPRLLFPSPPHL